ADLCRSELALRRFMHHALDFIHDSFEFRRGHGPLLTSFQQSLQNFLAFEALSPPILLDDHVRDFINALVGRKPSAALETLPPPPDRVTGAALARVDHLIVQMRAEW